MPKVYSKRKLDVPCEYIVTVSQVHSYSNLRDWLNDNCCGYWRFIGDGISAGAILFAKETDMTKFVLAHP